MKLARWHFIKSNLCQLDTTEKAIYRRQKNLHEAIGIIMPLNAAIFDEIDHVGTELLTAAVVTVFYYI